MKKIGLREALVLMLVVSLFSLFGCGFFKRNYLYEPSVIERSTVTDDQGKTSVKINDAAVISFYDAAAAAWTRRSQITSGINMGLQAESGLLGILPTVATVIGVVLPIDGFVSIGNAVIGKIADVLNPQSRTTAFDQALELGKQSRDAYFRALKIELKDQYKSEVPSDKLTDAGRVFWGEIDGIVGKINDALAQRISVSAPIAGSGENVVRGAIFIGPNPNPATMPPTQ